AYSEMIVEVGNNMTPGSVQMWAWRGGASRRLEDAPLRSAPAFGLATAGGGRLLGVADHPGRAVVFEIGDRMTLVGEAARLGWAVGSAAAGDFFGDGGVQAVVIGYPSRLHVVQIVEGG